MTVSERRNYQAAVLFSIMLHLSLVLISFPVRLQLILGGTEEIAVGIYDIRTDSAPQVTIAKHEPELFVKAEKVKTETRPPQPASDSPTKPGPKPTGGVQKRSPTAVGDHPKIPAGLGTGAGMIAGFGQEPYYPKNALNEGVEGEVLVRALIKADGALEGVELLRSSGDPRLDKSATNSLQQEWQFKPNAEDYYIDILFSFEIKSGVTFKLINSSTRP